jgi:hypothetical protein
MDSQACCKDRLFSVELKSKANLRSLTIASNSAEEVLVEGVLGELERARFAEGIILEVVCSNGTIRIDLREDEIIKPKRNENGGEAK